MCFSAGASFGASAVLGTLGIVTLKKAKTTDQIPFAAIPLLFGAQQVAEGALWVGFSGNVNESWKHFPVYIFLIFAQLIWPVWVPFSVLRLEENRVRRTIIKVILGAGACISLYLAYCISVYEVKAEIHSGHIMYTLDFPTDFMWVTSTFYFIPTVGSLFISSNRKIQLLGVGVLASFLLSKIYFAEHLISVWCFFAAIISMVILWIVSKLNNAVPQRTG